MRTLAALLLAALAARAQEPAATFSTTTRLVEFSFVALDKSGKPVTDLKMEDIQVSDKGKRRALSFFRFEGGSGDSKPAVALPPGLFTNRVEFTPGPPRNVTALVLDTLNTAPADILWVRAQLTRYLKALAPQTRVAVYHLGSKLSILHDFTGDVEELRARIAKAGLALPQQQTSDMNATVRDAEEMLRMFNNEPAILEMLTTQIENEMQANASVRQRNMEMTLAALETLGRHLSGVPGRKNLVWIGGGISMLSITGSMGFGARGGIQSFESVVRASAQRLAQQGVALYFVNSRGLQGDTSYSASSAGSITIRGRGRFEKQQQAEEISSDPFPAASTMAGITGGRVIQNTNDFTDGLKKATADVQGSYSAAFYLEDEPDGKWHTLKVQVNRPGVNVSVREGFLSEKQRSKAVAWTTEEWRSAIHNPMPSTALVVDARCEMMPGAERGTVGLTAQVEPSGLYFQMKDGVGQAQVEICVAEKAATGEVVVHTEDGSVTAPGRETRRVGPESARYQRVWKPSPGAQTIRVIIRDKVTGQYGVVDIPTAKIPSYPEPGK
ncbi:VWA domain-containing protein [Paludibaculum fermentans]|uniref:VWA domain-containing protein n=1 Tax=Paludibaculum fermentans TaxID=1473598 RepID=A0A7S7SK09_PALFE|nr:VWA domain-containing protein [Paludibaculum fermentans]QOY86500.1 VWA domain-containing protein [Paludibaculum fermentans]